MHRLYKGEIEYLDEHFARLIDELRRHGLWEDTVIALVSDHGEEFYEHGGWWHGTTLYDEQIRVPFLLKGARNAKLPSSTDGQLARMLDVAPTLIAATGAAVPDAMQGVDLARGLDARSERERMVFAEEDHEGNVLRAIRTEHWKWIEANPGNPRGVPEQELFHVAKDPKEERNVAEETAWVVQELAAHAEAQQKLASTQSVGGATAASLTPMEEQALRDLGYISE